MCLGYEYKTLATILGHSMTVEAKMEVTPSFPPASQTSQEAAALMPLVSTPPRNLLSVAVAPTCTPRTSGCRPGIAGKRPQNIPIIDRTWGRPTAGRAKLGEIVMQSTGNGERVEPVTGWVRLMWVAAVLGGFAGIMVALS